MSPTGVGRSPRMREPNYSVRWMASNQPAALEAQLVAAFAAEVRTEAVKEAPIGKGPTQGALRKSITVDKGRVLAKAPHAVYVHEGTRPHPIYPRPPRRFLRFEGRDGRIVFARRVAHPGTKPNPFLRRAMMNVYHRSASITQPALERWLQENRVR